LSNKDSIWNFVIHLENFVILFTYLLIFRH